MTLEHLQLLGILLVETVFGLIVLGAAMLLVCKLFGSKKGRE